MRTLKKKYYFNCELLPLWNFFKVNSAANTDVKYLVVLKDRLDYNDLVITEGEQIELLILWGKIFEEYNQLENNFGVKNFINDRVKILYYLSIYLQEKSMLQSLLYKTNVNHIKTLRSKGYRLRNTSQSDYWEDLTNGLKQVENHITYIETLKNKVNSVDGDSKKEGNPYDSVMAWIASERIDVNDNITVARYIKIKEIILARNKARKKVQQPQYA